jgi:SAM-dependent methyltransferase
LAEGATIGPGASPADHEYRGLMAEAWDLLRGDTSTWPDRPFYRAAIAESGEPGLDVGCGTGRLLLDYLAEGVDIDGVDVSPEMLAICARKARLAGLAPTLFRQSIERLRLPRRYLTILVPSSTIQLLTEPAAVRQALQRLQAHLEPGGTLVMSIMVLGASEDGEAWQLEAEARRPEDGAVIRRWSRCRYDDGAQLEHTQDRYEVVLEGRVVARENFERSPATRSYTVEQAKTLLEESGFAQVRAVAGFTDRPASSDDDLFCIFARRPPADV